MRFGEHGARVVPRYEASDTHDYQGISVHETSLRARSARAAVDAVLWQALDLAPLGARYERVGAGDHHETRGLSAYRQ